MVLETYMKLYLTEPDFYGGGGGGGGENVAPKIGKTNQKCAKFGHYFLLNLFYNEILYYLLCSCTNPIFEKIFVSEILAKMLSANQIAGFFNQRYL